VAGEPARGQTRSGVNPERLNKFTRWKGEMEGCNSRITLMDTFLDKMKQLTMR